MVSLRAWPAALLALLWTLQLGSAARDFPGVGINEQPVAERVILNTNFGPIPIKLYNAAAPETTKLVLQLAQSGGCATGCQFYRNEAKPWQPNSWPPVLAPGNGPPYSLLQGVMNLAAVPPSENQISVKMGHVCMIPGTKDFFIAYGDHPEWAASHTVWGELDNNWLAVDLIIAQDYNKVKHPEHGTEMRMLKQEVKFTVTADTPAPQL